MSVGAKTAFRKSNMLKKLQRHICINIETLKKLFKMSPFHLQGRGEEDKRQKNKLPIFWVIVPMPGKAGTGPSQSQETGTPSWSPTWVAGADTWAISNCLPSHTAREPN